MRQTDVAFHTKTIQLLLSVECANSAQNMMKPEVNKIKIVAQQTDKIMYITFFLQHFLHRRICLYMDKTTKCNIIRATIRLQNASISE